MNVRLALRTGLALVRRYWRVMLIALIVGGVLSSISETVDFLGPSMAQRETAQLDPGPLPAEDDARYRTYVYDLWAYRQALNAAQSRWTLYAALIALLNFFVSPWIMLLLYRVLLGKSRALTPLPGGWKRAMALEWRIQLRILGYLLSGAAVSMALTFNMPEGLAGLVTGAIFVPVALYADARYALCPLFLAEGGSARSALNAGVSALKEITAPTLLAALWPCLALWGITLALEVLWARPVSLLIRLLLMALARMLRWGTLTAVCQQIPSIEKAAPAQL